MSDRNTKIATFDRDLSRAFRAVCPIATQVAVIGIAQRLAYEWETRRLREILGREPTIWDRLEYRICWELARPVRQVRHVWSDEAKICEAAWEDAGKSKAIWW